ncbi:aspartate aminotransferase family protein [Pseudohaliea sp.]|uniref:aspartate aminotransferase family protein n=1 Tax=Pseudohaliea sp. TaxID=2740289 RepID=UPI0032EB7CC8
MALAKIAGQPSHGVDPRRIDTLMAREVDQFRREHRTSAELHEKTKDFFVHGVPLHWMSQWPGPNPVFVERASGTSLVDVDGNTYVDFCLGDSGAFFGHANPQVSAAIAEYVQRNGSTMMLPTEDALYVGEELSRRFGLPVWQYATSATDANRFAIRIARMVTGRDKILVFNGKYHGSVDETQVELEDGEMVPQHGIHPNATRFGETTVCIEFNDVSALEAALSAGDIACILAEPVMTNIGMVPVDDGFHESMRDLSRKYGTLIVIDETHTICFGPGGYTATHGLEPDFLVVGKVLAGGIPSAVYGMSKAIANQLEVLTGAPGINHYGFGGTLTGNALTVRAMRATLEHVATDKNFERVFHLAEQLRVGIDNQIRTSRLPWHVLRFGARVEYLFRPAPARNGSEAAAARDDFIESYIHLHALNRGVLLTPFHNMALVSPATSGADVERYLEVFAACLDELAA